MAKKRSGGGRFEVEIGERLLLVLTHAIGVLLGALAVL